MSRCVAALRRCVLDWLLDLVRDIKHEEAWAALPQRIILIRHGQAEHNLEEGAVRLAAPHHPKASALRSTRQPHACQDDVRHVPEGRGRVTFWAEAADELHAKSFLWGRLSPPERCVLRPEPRRLSAVAQEMCGSGRPGLREGAHPPKV